MTAHNTRTPTTPRTRLLGTLVGLKSKVFSFRSVPLRGASAFHAIAMAANIGARRP